MATLVLRQTKGTPLSVIEVDSNFQNLNNALGANGSSIIPTPSGTGSPVLSDSATLTGNITVSGTLSNTATTALKLPAGTTAQRPSSPTLGQVRYNSTLNLYEGYDGTIWASLLNSGTTISVSQGGTGATTLTANSVLLGNGTNALQSVVPGTSGNVLTSSGGSWVSSPAAVSLPSQTGNTGRYLKTDGTSASWTDTLTGIKLGSYQESVVNITASTASTTVDLSLGSVFNITIAANTTIVFTNFPAGTVLTSFTIITVNDATAGRAVSWPASVTWAGNVLPPRTTTASKSDAWALFTLNAGTKIVGSLSVANF